MGPQENLDSTGSCCTQTPFGTKGPQKALDKPVRNDRAPFLYAERAADDLRSERTCRGEGAVPAVVG